MGVSLVATFDRSPKLSIKSTPCRLCGEVIHPETQIWPLDPDDFLLVSLSQQSTQNQQQSGSGHQQEAALVPANAKLVWIHASCAGRALQNLGREFPLRPPSCPHFERRGQCIHNDRCFLWHAPENNERNNDEIFCLPVGGGGPRPGGVSGREKGNMFGKTARVGVFRRWLLDEFGLRGTSSESDRTDVVDRDHPTSQGAGPRVIDIAGGKGELAFELAVLNGVHCTVVDPRAICLQEYEAKLRRGGYHWNQVLGQHVTTTNISFREGRLNVLEERGRDSGDEDHGRGPWLPARLFVLHLKIFFDQELIDWCRDTAKGDNVFLCSAARKVDSQVLIGESTHKQRYRKVNGRLEKLALPPAPAPPTKVLGTRTPDHHNNDLHVVKNSLVYVEQPASDETAKRLLLDADLVLGMHLDGAAEAAIDFALTFNKSFAIVPCCTCSKLFPARRIGEGESRRLVRSYDDLIEYLMNKDPCKGGEQRFRKTRLGFDGKNVVIYRKVV